MRNTLLFKSEIFNNSEPREYFINDCCFCDYLAAWLKQSLEQKSYSIGEPIQEDWGWLLSVEKGGSRFHLNIGYVPKPDDLWEVIVEPCASLFKRLTGVNQATEMKRLCLDLHEVVSGKERNGIITWLQIDGRGVESDESEAP